MVGLYIGVFILILGVVVVGIDRGERRRIRRLLGATVRPIKSAVGEGTIGVRGRVRPIEGAVLRAPYSETKVVWAKITVAEQVSSGKTRQWRELFSDVVSQPFLLDDGSGQQARVDPRGAEVLAEDLVVATSGVFNAAQPKLEALLRAHGEQSTGLLGLSRTLRVTEQRILPGDTVRAAASARRVQGPMLMEAYRAAHGSQLELHRGGDDQDRCVLSNRSDRDLERRLYLSLTIGAVMIAGGLVIAAIGAYVGMSGPSTARDNRAPNQARVAEP